MAARGSTEEFVKKAQQVHQGRYSYGLTKYEKSQIKVTVTCPVHGDFLITPNNHLCGKGCKECANEGRSERKKLSQEEFIAASRNSHGDLYDYTKAVYTAARDKITIICKEHGPFSQTADSHMRGVGCPECAKLARWNERRTEYSEFVRRANKKHGNKFEYPRELFEKITGIVGIVCPEHGVFYQEGRTHLATKHACRDCQSKAVKLSKEEFIERAKEFHAERYDYGLVEMSGADAKVKIVCPDHGVFEQAASSHLRGCGCRYCNASAEEYQIKSWLEAEGCEVETGVRSIIPPYELDLYLPQNRLAIEYCGLYWHRTSERRPSHYHKTKLEMCRKAGVRLVTVFSDEWGTKQALVKSTLLAAIRKKKPKKIGARSLKLLAVSKDQAKAFLNTHHLQGFTAAEQWLALCLGEELMALAGVSKQRAIYGNRMRPGLLELVRYAEHSDYKVIGALTKLIKEIKKENPEASSIVSYSDLRWFTGASLAEAGFVLLRESAPGYFYTKGAKRYSRFGFAKHQLRDKLEVFDPGKTEKQNMLDNNYNLLHDCGAAVYELCL